MTSNFPKLVNFLNLLALIAAKHILDIRYFLSLKYDSVLNKIKLYELSLYLFRKLLIKLYDNIVNYMNDMVTVNKPYGGYFLWLQLNNNIDTNSLLQFSDKYKVKFHPGNKFSGYNNLKNCLRISFSYYPKEGMSVGAERLSNMIKDNINDTSTEKIKVSVLGYSELECTHP